MEQVLTIPKKKIKINPLLIAVFIILMVYAITIIALLAWGFLTSLKTSLDFNELGNVLGLPNVAAQKDMYLENYQKYLDHVALGGDPSQTIMWTASYDQYLLARKNIFMDNYLKAIRNFGNFSTGDWSYISDIWGPIQKLSVRPNFFETLFNSLFYAVFGAVAHAGTCLVVGYLCSKYRYKFSNFLYSLVVVIMVIPIVGAAPSMIELMKTTGMFDTYLGMIFQKINFTGMYFLVFYAYYLGLSDAYIEAAEIDGASQIRVFTTIIIPLASKMFWTIFILDFITMWNDYTTALMYFPTHPTVSYAIYRMVGTTEGEARDPEQQGPPAYIAGCMILALPMIILFVFMSDRIMGNVSMGGLKE